MYIYTHVMFITRNIYVHCTYFYIYYIHVNRYVYIDKYMYTFFDMFIFVCTNALRVLYDMFQRLHRTSIHGRNDVCIHATLRIYTHKMTTPI